MADSGNPTASKPPAGGNQTNITGDVYEPVLSGTFHEQVEIILAPGLTAPDRDNRRRLLAQVRQFWIAGKLEQSLYREVMLTLKLARDPHEVRPANYTAIDHGAGHHATLGGAGDCQWLSARYSPECWRYANQDVRLV